MRYQRNLSFERRAVAIDKFPAGSFGKKRAVFALLGAEGNVNVETCD